MYSYSEEYCYTLFAYLIIPFYFQLGQFGQGLHNNLHTEFEKQSQEEIDLICKQEIDNLFDDGDSVNSMPDSPLFNRLRKKDRNESQVPHYGPYEVNERRDKCGGKADPECVFSMDGWTDNEVRMWKDGHGFEDPVGMHCMTSTELSQSLKEMVDCDINHGMNSTSHDVGYNAGNDLKGQCPPVYFKDMFDFLDDE